MTIESAPTPVVKLGFGATFSAAFSAVFGQILMVLKAAILPFLLSLIFAVLGFYVLVNLPEMSLPVQILGYLPFVIFGIACCRLVLMGRHASAIPRPLLGKRTLLYFGYTLLFTLIVALPAFVITLVVFGGVALSANVGLDNAILEDFSQSGLLIPLIFIIYLFYLYLITRISLVFPAVAADQKLSLVGSWRITRGSGFKLYLVLVVITILSIIGIVIAMLIANSLVAVFVGGLTTMSSDAAAAGWTSIALAAAPTAILGLAFEYLSFALIIAAITSAYAQLSGWGGPREEVLQRFE